MLVAGRDLPDGAKIGDLPGSPDRPQSGVAQGAAVAAAPGVNLAILRQRQGVLGPGRNRLDPQRGESVGHPGGRADDAPVRVHAHLPLQVVAPGINLSIRIQGQAVPRPGGDRQEIGGQPRSHRQEPIGRCIGDAQLSVGVGTGDQQRELTPQISQEQAMITSCRRLDDAGQLLAVCADCPHPRRQR